MSSNKRKFCFVELEIAIITIRRRLAVCLLRSGGSCGPVRPIHHLRGSEAVSEPDRRGHAAPGSRPAKGPGRRCVEGRVRGNAWHAIRGTARAREQDGGCLYTAGRCAHCPAGAFSLCLAVEGVLCGVVGALNQASVHSQQSTQLPQRCRSLAIAKLLKVKATHSTPPQANGIFKTSTAMRAVCPHSTCFHLVHWFRSCTALEYRTRACVHFNCIQMPLLRHSARI